MGLDFKEWVALAALSVVVIGWFVSNWQANRREDRKEGRALIDDAKELANKIADDAVSYQLDAESDLAPAIKSALDVLEVELGRIPSFNVKGGPLVPALIDLQEAATGGDFETKTRIAKDFNSPEIAQIFVARSTLLAELERQFRAHYL